MTYNRRIKQTNLLKVISNNDNVIYQNGVKLKKGTYSNITDHIMEGLMFIIKQDKNVVTIYKQMTKVNMNNVFDNLKIVASDDKCLLHSNHRRYENLMTPKKESIELSRQKNNILFKKKFIQFNESTNKIEHGTRDIMKQREKLNMQQIPKQIDSFKTMHCWSQLFKSTKRLSSIEEDIEKAFNDASVEMNQNDKKDFVLSLDKQNDRVSKEATNSIKQMQIIILKCTLTLNCINAVKNPLEHHKVTSIETITNYRSLRRLFNTIENKTSIIQYITKEILKTNIDIRCTNEDLKYVRITRSKANLYANSNKMLSCVCNEILLKNQYLSTNSIKSLSSKISKKQLQDSMDKISLEKRKIDQDKNYKKKLKTAKTKNKVIQIDIVKLISDLSYGIKIIVKRLDL